MCAHYETPVLLIEFDEQKSFSLQSLHDIGSDISIQDLTSKLSLLAITFPKLRTIWSSSAYATADIFADLKKNHAEPDADAAAMVGASDQEDAHISMNLVSQELLRSLPGITSMNYRLLARKVRHLTELSSMSQKALADIIGESGARQLYKFLHSDSL
ncbi:RAD1 DNA repair protein [Syncephalis pseudoplumigaleata]|uniref:RAD1 DNA repair protein n=1 Tax=Syncephalis pseudoplumigaleata TaxID=1712513 RepID=A0A4P9YUG9_9FUNG|nr:RAD1 DNA repair protein [Syncephalis pseudoplumigaleata]|eukprot:RKP23673.1 RAD1 DNA repair protein [Syncephalis pseudoplumigaleata]